MKASQIILMIARWIWRPKSPYLYPMKVIFKDDGTVVEAVSAADLVTWMRESATFTLAQSNKEYMLQYARRAVVAYDQDIRATSEEEFVKDLIQFQHIHLVETP